MSKLNAIRGHSGVSDLMVARTRIPTAEVLLLNTTPQVVVPNPGPGRAILFERATCQLVQGATDYGTDGDLVIQYQTTGTEVSQRFDDWINDASGSGAAMVMWRVGTETAVQTVGALVENEALVITQLTNNPTTGDRDLIVTVWYHIVNMVTG